MNAHSDHLRHSAPLQLFEDCFEPLLLQSRNIVISYELYNQDQISKLGKLLEVISVCGCDTPESFRTHLQHLILPSLDKMMSMLSMVDPMYWKSYITYARDKLMQLTDHVGNGLITSFDDDNLCNQDHKIKSFKSVIPLGPCRSDTNRIIGSLCCKSAKYAEVWIEVIYDTIDRLELMHSLLIQSASALSEKHNKSLSPDKNDVFKIKTNLSVPQLGVFFRMLVKFKLLVIPHGFLIELIRWITRQLNSKNSESITLSSMRNKYFTLETVALDFWEEMLKNWLVFIQEERERLSR